MIAGFLLGAWAQPDSYHWQWDAISSLASQEAAQRWWMTGGFVGNGICHLFTARRMPRSWGRVLIAVGGVAVLLVALFPEQPDHTSFMHDFGAGLAFFTLAAWPVFAIDERVWATRRNVAIAASATMLTLLAWFLATLFGVPALGLVERALAVAEALWPLIVLESVRRSRESVA
ncbi:MAG TPA: DUF998 domain-containing protein [Polyangiales bacterium]|nr:DUF998 domain-containing protein [Polyangiales bacterium]